MPLPLPLPPTLAGKPFTIKQAKAAGLTRRRSRAQDHETGGWVQDPDMSCEDLEVALQYDGGHHAAPAQRRSDIFRDEKARGLGWLVVVLTQWDLDIWAPGDACAPGMEPQAVTRVRAALASRGWRPSR